MRRVKGNANEKKYNLFTKVAKLLYKNTLVSRNSMGSSQKEGH